MKRASRLELRFLGLGGGLAILGVAGAGFWFVVTHRYAVAVSPQAAEIEFSQLRARFANQQPLLDMRRREVAEISGGSQGVSALRSFHTVVFDTRGSQRIVRMTVPYWLASRFAGHDRVFRWLGQLTFLDDTEFDPEPIYLSVTQLERRGPGLVVYYRHPDGGQFISWVE